MWVARLRYFAAVPVSLLHASVGRPTCGLPWTGSLNLQFRNQRRRLLPLVRDTAHYLEVHCCIEGSARSKLISAARQKPSTKPQMPGLS